MFSSYKQNMQISSDNKLALDIDSYSMLKRTMSVSMAARKNKKTLDLSLLRGYQTLNEANIPTLSRRSMELVAVDAHYNATAITR